MAFAHESQVLARREGAAPRGGFALGPLAQRAQGPVVRCVLYERQHLLEILQRGGQHPIGRAEALVRPRERRAGMELGDHGGERVDMRRVERPARKGTAGERFLRKLAHPDRILQHRPVATYARSLGHAADLDEFQVQFRSEPAVQPQFLLAVMAAQPERGEVQEAEVHGLLDLVGVLARQQDPRDVRFQHPHAAHRVRIARRIQERREQRRHSIGRRGGACRRGSK